MTLISPSGPRTATIMALALALWGSLPPHADRPPHNRDSNGVMQESEELIYEVSWTVIKLGTIRIKTFRDYRAEAHIDSYDGIPFVDLHSIHYCTMDSNFFSLGSRSIDKKENEWRGIEYIYDLAHRILTVEETFRSDPQLPPVRQRILDTLRLNSDKVVDGLSIAYFPRSLIHTKQTVNVPTVLYGKIGVTTYRFTDIKSEEAIGALDRPVRVVELDGSTTAEGLYGMTGEFRGWFSDDAAAVPIKGKLKVLIGNVTVELVGWHRSGWAPP